MPILLKFFQKIEEEGTIHFMRPNSFYEASITLIPKSDKDTTREENYRPISLMKIDVKSSTKYQQTEFNNTLKVPPHDQVGFFPVMQKLFNIHKSSNMIYHIKRMKDKNHMIILIDAEKTLDKIQHLFIKKTLYKVGIEEM